MGWLNGHFSSFSSLSRHGRQDTLLVCVRSAALVPVLLRGVEMMSYLDECSIIVVRVVLLLGVGEPYQGNSRRVVTSHVTGYFPV